MSEFYTLYTCDVIEGLARIPDESIDCIVTSPPYYGLRNYGVDAQLGIWFKFDDEGAWIIIAKAWWDDGTALTKEDHGPHNDELEEAAEMLLLTLAKQLTAVAE